MIGDNYRRIFVVLLAHRKLFITVNGDLFDLVLVIEQANLEILVLFGCDVCKARMLKFLLSFLIVILRDVLTGERNLYLHRLFFDSLGLGRLYGLRLLV